MTASRRKRWSQRVTETSNALDLEPGVFTWRNPRRIARSLARSAERSRRRKTDAFRSAMSMLTFYINRAGRDLDPEQRARLERAKGELRALFGRPRRGGRAPARYHVRYRRVAPRVVLDAHVLVSALRSNRGASFRLLSEIDSGRFEICVSVPLVVEYEAALRRHARSLGLSRRDVSDVLDYICSVARRQAIFFLWRPQLPDPGDDMVLEAAVAGGCRYVVTFDTRDFESPRSFGVKAVTPREFLRLIGVIQ